MPFKSKAQQRFMFSQHPGIAHRWADEMKSSHRKGAKQHPISAAGLPQHVGKSVERLRAGARTRIRKDFPMVPDYRLGANYRTGTASVGRRIVEKRSTGAVAGVLKPKKVLPTKTAPRTLGAAASTKPPIPASEVGKALPMRAGAKRALQQAAGQRGASKISSAMKLPQSPRIASARQGRGALVQMPGAGGKPGVPRERSIAKRDRRYDAEDRRQRRLGGAVAATGAAGAAVTAQGVQRLKLTKPKSGARLYVTGPAARRLGAGGALVAASAGLAHHSRSNANRRRS